MTGTPRTRGPLIGPGELAGVLSSASPPVLIDVRWRLAGPPGRLDYEAGHLPGARFADLDAELSGPPGAGGRHPLPDPARFAETMRRAGVRRDRGVVAYDESDGVAAARLWWLLRYHGHDDVRILDGGYRGWVGAGYAVSDAEPPVGGGDFEARPGGMPVLDADAAARLARDGGLVDARAPERYRGEVEPVDPVAGHIPGARNVPTSAVVDGSGRLLPAGVLRERFAEAGIGVGGTDARTGSGAEPGGPARTPPVGAYCGSGVTASHLVLALEVAGIPAALYPGSWSEWIRDPGHPIAVGDELPSSRP